MGFSIMGNDFGQALKTIVFFCIVVGMIIVVSVNKGGEYFFHTNDIESTKPITPIKKLIINDNKIDTLYIYRSN